MSQFTLPFIESYIIWEILEIKYRFFVHQQDFHSRTSIINHLCDVLLNSNNNIHFELFTIYIHWYIHCYLFCLKIKQNLSLIKKSWHQNDDWTEGRLSGFMLNLVVGRIPMSFVGRIVIFFQQALDINPPWKKSRTIPLFIILELLNLFLLCFDIKLSHSIMN